MYVFVMAYIKFYTMDKRFKMHENHFYFFSFLMCTLFIYKSDMPKIPDKIRIFEAKQLIFRLLGKGCLACYIFRNYFTAYIMFL